MQQLLGDQCCFTLWLQQCCHLQQAFCHLCWHCHDANFLDHYSFDKPKQLGSLSLGA